MTSEWQIGMPIMSTVVWWVKNRKEAFDSYPGTALDGHRPGERPVRKYSDEDPCVRGHIDKWRIRPAGGRECTQCSLERNQERKALVGQAARCLGLKRQEYIEQYGESTQKARAVLASCEQDK
jgi:hypothetical protein